MKYTVTMLPTARQELFEIRAYLEQLSQTAAERILNKIFSRIGDLVSAPRLYAVSEEDARFRKMVAGDYLVFYTLDEDKQLVEIHHVWHGMRNIRRELEKLQ